MKRDMGGEPDNACFLIIPRTRTHAMSTTIAKSFEDVIALMPLTSRAALGTRSPSAGHQNPVRSKYLSARRKFCGSACQHLASPQDFEDDDTLLGEQRVFLSHCSVGESCKLPRDSPSIRTTPGLQHSTCPSKSARSSSSSLPSIDLTLASRSPLANAAPAGTTRSTMPRFRTTGYESSRWRLSRLRCAGVIFETSIKPAPGNIPDQAMTL